MDNPIQFAIYKGTGGRHGAMQFNFQPPHYYRDDNGNKDFTGNLAIENIQRDGKNVRRLKEGWQVREGAIFLHITSAKDKNIYDWDNKIVIALSVVDMGKLLFTTVTGKDCNLTHDPGARSENQGTVKKFLNVSSPQGVIEGGLFFTARKISGGQTIEHKVPMTPDETITLRTLLQTAISRALDWI